MNLALFAPLLLTALPLEPPTSAERPALVVQVTVDQLRGDALPRLRQRFGEGGFRRLLEGGAWFADAHYRHSTTFTAVGHATLFTGAGPSAHGLVGNDWAERETGARVYCCQDPAEALLGGALTPPHVGTSPRNLIGSTVGDELVLQSAGRGRVFSVSVKDRGAILPGGALGRAFWYASRSGEFISSTYYYGALPTWVSEWNAAGHADRYAGASWTLSRPLAEYNARDLQMTDIVRPPGNLGASFPHPLPAEQPYSVLRYTPFGDELTVDFALELLEREALGRGDAPDLLAISLSCTDYIGHAYGPNGLEAEDNLLRLDATLARLLDGVDAQVGLERTLVVLSSDHGIDSIPEYRHELTCSARSEESGWVPRDESPRYLQHAASGLPCCAAGRQDPARVLAAAEKVIHERLGLAQEQSWVRAFWNPNLYLDPAAVEASGLSLERAARLLAGELQRHAGIEYAVTRADLLTSELPDSSALGRLQRSFQADRCGDLMVLTAPGWFLFPAPDRIAAMHGSAWAYDTHVPIVFAGPGVPRGRTVYRAVSPSDIAPTVAAILGIEPPAVSDGSVLSEVMGGE